MNYPTGSDLCNPSIIPPLGARRSPDVGPFALMVSSGTDMRYITRKIEGAETVGFFNSSLTRPPQRGERGQGFSVTGPFIGAPYAVMLLESLVARGADRVLVLGWCGSLSEEVRVGDLIVPGRAFVDEGTSRHYRCLDHEIPYSMPDEGFSEELSRFLVSSGLAPHHRGSIWTTDAIYRETRAKVDHFRERGAIAVEMECSALFSAAAFRKVSVAGLLVVSDSVAASDWEPGFRRDVFKNARQAACDVLLDFMKQREAHG